MTYKELKQIVLQKLFLTEDGTVDLPDDDARDYLYALPAAANEGMQRLYSTDGRPLIKSVQLLARQSGQVFDMAQQAEDFARFDGRVFGSENRPFWQYATDGVQKIWFASPGEYQVYYFARPKPLLEDTPDDFVLPLEEDMAVLLPLYVASQLYKDDDGQISTSYRNEFEAALAALGGAKRQYGHEQFYDKAGWL